MKNVVFWKCFSVWDLGRLPLLSVSGAIEYRVFLLKGSKCKATARYGQFSSLFSESFPPPDTPIRKSGDRRSVGHSVPFYSFLFPLLPEIILLAKISICNGCELFTLLWETGSVLNSVYSSAYESGHQASLWKLSLVCEQYQYKKVSCGEAPPVKSLLNW